ncbi:hypothetical protein A0256_13535 [Mucilaginibacter sp. PAMC 26640]|nr:hypothetical protein A0256_13535 [Mucilaginibacter sp. PAMC 26640]
MYNIKVLAVVFFQTVLMGGSAGFAQPLQTRVKRQMKVLEGDIKYAIAKAYPASVLLWETEQETGNRISAQFSGVVVSADGVILSAAHVVTAGKTYNVIFPDGKECCAKGLGRISFPPDNMLPDAAMLKIVQKGSWPFAAMAWSASLQVNQPCISIAYPETVEQRKPDVRFGHITVLKNEFGFLQSSCLMEPGDSGGPLFDLSGRVIGIHSGIQVPEIINYEVPIDIFRRYWLALSKVESYTALPADTSFYEKDPLAGGIAEQRQSALWQGLDQIGAKLNESCLKITSKVDGRQQQITGTLISLGGLAPAKAIAAKDILISKSSMVGESPSATLPNGSSVALTVLARSKEIDLILLLPEKKLGTGIRLTTFEQNPIDFADVGTLLISPRPDSMALTGVLSSMDINLPPKTSYGYIGAAAVFRYDQLVLDRVQLGSAAEAGGMQKGDIIKSVNGLTVNDELDFVKALRKHLAGDTITLAALRAGEEIQKVIVLKYPPPKAE